MDVPVIPDSLLGQIHNRDCLEGLAELPDGCVDLAEGVQRDGFFSESLEEPGHLCSTTN